MEKIKGQKYITERAISVPEKLLYNHSPKQGKEFSKLFSIPDKNILEKTAKMDFSNYEALTEVHLRLGKVVESL